MAFKKQYLKSKPICKVTFKLSAEEAKSAKSVDIAGDFNNWDATANPMKKLKNGSFTATIDLPVEKRYEFRYLLDQQTWANDWKADAYSPSSVSCEENSVLEV